MIRNLKLSTTSHLSENGEGLETEIIINHAYFYFAIETQMYRANVCYQGGGDGLGTGIDIYTPLYIK